MSIKHLAILTDVSKCTGCEKCVAACQEQHKLPAEKPWRWVKRITDLSSARWTTIRRVTTDQDLAYVRRQCRHCLEPACVEACIVGALQRTAAGAVTYDSGICIGCRYCMIACPWEIPKYSWEDTVPYVQKCDFCYERVTQEGKLPACVAACPSQATIFGERAELLAEAWRRVTEQPQQYIQHVWGEKEVGGTSVLYVSHVDLNLTAVAQPISDTVPMPQRTFKILRHMPLTFVGVAVLMGGVYWAIERRQKLAAKDGAEPERIAQQGSGDKPDEDQDGAKPTGEAEGQDEAT